jgi:hypothetical protein
VLSEGGEVKDLRIKLVNESHKRTMEADYAEGCTVTGFYDAMQAEGALFYPTIASKSVSWKTSLT